MRLRTQMLKTTVTSLLAFMFIVLIVLVPRDLNLSLDGNLVVTNYSFDLGQYVTYIRDYFASAVQNGTLGERGISASPRKRLLLKLLAKACWLLYPLY